MVKQGIAGGDEAAKLLKRAVFNYLRHDEDFKHDHRIVIRVYANLRGLSKTYADKGILPNTAAFFEFVLGFNKAHPLCDFIDAGNHKEAADTKLKGALSKRMSLQTVADFSLQKTSVCMFTMSIANRSSSARRQTMAMHPS
jgi:hypothetical protein